MTNITMLSFLLLLPVIFGLLIINSRNKKSSAIKIAATLLILIAAILFFPGFKALLLIVVTLAMLAAFVYRDNKTNFFKGASIVIIIVLVFTTALNIYYSNRMPIILKASQSYIMDINETKNSGDTSIKLKKVFMDLNNINMTYSVRGKEKLVAIELKRNIDDIKPISQCTGLWVGRRVLSESSFVGMSYSSDQFIDPVYAVFYLSNGEGIPFEIQDRTNIKNSVKIIDINKTLDYNGSTLTLSKFYKGLNYSSIDFNSNFNPKRELIDVRLIVDSSEMEAGPSGWSGSTSGYEGSFGFDPVSGDKVRIKVINKQLNKEDIIDVDIK